MKIQKQQNKANTKPKQKQKQQQKHGFGNYNKFKICASVHSSQENPKTLLVAGVWPMPLRQKSQIDITTKILFSG